jgi:hypothetical protein
VFLPRSNSRISRLRDPSGRAISPAPSTLLLPRRLSWYGFGATGHATPQAIQGYEATHMIRKGQIEETAKRDVLVQNGVTNELFELAA